MYKGLITEDMTKCHKLCLELLKESHVLIAGTTGSGKSVLMNSMIYTAMRMAVDKLYFIDLKQTEMRPYKKLYNCAWHCTRREMVIPLLSRVVRDMNKRFGKMRGKMYDGEPTYIFIDEIAHLVNDTDRKFNKAVLDLLVQIGRLGRAANIHLICATQDPSRKTLCAQLMQNFTCTIALRCRSSIESRQIVGVAGAEELPRYGKGIMWNAEGITTVDIPLTPEKDIERMAKAMSVLGETIAHFSMMLKHKLYVVDEDYEARLDRGLATW